jgi:hypothetical protein
LDLNTQISDLNTRFSRTTGWLILHSALENIAFDAVALDFANKYELKREMSFISQFQRLNLQKRWFKSTLQSVLDLPMRQALVEILSEKTGIRVPIAPPSPPFSLKELFSYATIIFDKEPTNKVHVRKIAQQLQQVQLKMRGLGGHAFNWPILDDVELVGDTVMGAFSFNTVGLDPQ